MKIIIEMDDQAYNYVMKLLDEQPHKIVRSIIDNFQAQMLKQLNSNTEINAKELQILSKE